MADQSDFKKNTKIFFHSSAGKEALILLVVFIVFSFISSQLDLFEYLFELLGENDRYEIDEIILVSATFSLFTSIYAMRRWMESLKLLKDQKETSLALNTANTQLNETATTLSAKQERSEQLSQLNNFLQVCKSKDEAFQFISESATSLFKDCSGALYVTKESRNQLNLVATWGEEKHSSFFSPDDCWGLRLGKRFSTSRDWGTPLCNHISKGDNKISTCYPLIAYGEIIGLFHVRIPETYAEPEIKAISASFEQSLVMFSEQISLSISNLDLHQKLRHLAIHDSLTGLYNRHYLEESFEREIHRAKRKKTKLGIIMMDLDHFKNLNDTYGHSAGDLVLMEVGRFISTFFRIEDFCCRFGGEEFFILLSDIDKNDFKEKCETIRQGIEDLKLIHQDTPLKKVTATLGVAIYPEHGENTSQLIEAADKALYRGKKSGRNRVQFAS